MPPLGLLIGGVDFRDLSATLKSPLGAVPAVMLRYGSFIQTVFDFAIIAFAVFLLIKAINALKRKREAAPAAPPKPSAEEVLLTENPRPFEEASRRGMNVFAGIRRADETRIALIRQNFPEALNYCRPAR